MTHDFRTVSATRSLGSPRGLLSAVLFLLALSFAAGAYVPDEATVRLMNHGVGLMEQHRFSEAASVFEKVVERAPDWATAYVNLGIAYLNAVSDPGKPGGSLDLAEQAFKRAAELDPSLPHAPYCLGLLARYRGDSDAALVHFQRVLELDPHSADALYFIGAVYLSKGEPATAAEYFRRAIDENPYLLSAHYSLAQTLIRTGKREEALERLEIFKRLDASKVGVKRAIVYTEMGEYAEVIRVFPPASDAPTIPLTIGPSRVQFVVDRTFTIGQTSGRRGFAVADLDGDGLLDLYAPKRALVAGDRTLGHGDLLYWNRGNRLDPTPFPVEVTEAVGGLFGDFDNDGDPDLYVLGEERNRLLRNAGDGTTWEDVTEETGVGAEGRSSVAAAWVDGDHDGDLDLFVLHRDGVSLFRNNLDGTFLDITEEAGFGDVDGATALALGDFDEDHDIDVALATSAGLRLFLNDRLNRWSDATKRAGFHDEAGGSALLSADFDRDGDLDLLLLRGIDKPARFFQNRGDATFERFTAPGGLAAETGTILDFDNDGDLDLFFPRGVWQDGSPRPLLLVNDGAGGVAEMGRDLGLDVVSLGNPGAVLAADLDEDGDPDLLIAEEDGESVFLRNEGGDANNWLHIALEGALANRSGYGAKVEVKAGSLWQKVQLAMIGGINVATNPRLEFGLDGRENVDFVRIVWPNAVLQSELEIAANGTERIKEVQRKASSCPILFAWNGERFGFVTDFLGVGGLGYFVAPGVTNTPDPTERIKLERDQLAPIDGEYRFEIMEPFEEIAYLDAAKLIAVDHPIGTEVYPDERLALDGNLPTERLYAYGERFYPVAATDHRGRDVLWAVTKRDRRYPPVERDPRFLGLLAEEHALTLDFGDAVTRLDPAKPWVLYVYGWIEYPYSHNVYAAAQAGIDGGGFHIDVQEADGTWREARRNVGYPAGMPKMMTLDLRPILSEGRSTIRLRTNLEIYVDEVFLAEDVGEGALRVTTALPTRAVLRYAGYPREYSPDGRLPKLYDYTSLDRSFAFRNMKGRYTRFGDVRELLTETDDLFVIMGRGETISLAFDASAFPPVPEGYTRSFLLDTTGFSKDMDLYTAYPDTVEPLPFHGMSAYPYPPTESYPDTDRTRRYREVYLTRRK